MKVPTILLVGSIGAAAAVGISFLWRVRFPTGGEANDSPRSAAIVERSSVGTSNASALPSANSSSPSLAASTREDRLRELARSHARADIAGAIAWLRTLSPADATLAMDAIFAEVGRDDPAGVLALGQALGYGSTDGRMEHIAQLWTEEEPAAAVAWISAQPPGADRDRLLARVALVRVSQDPAEAARLLGAMADGAARDAAIAETVARLRIYDPAKADSWLALLAGK